jgi:branched-chain amino acid transport system permease protein
VSYTVDPLLMTIIGGIGTLTGQVIGASGLTLLDMLFRDSTLMIGSLTIHIADIWSLLLGCIFIAVVIVFPQGVVGTVVQAGTIRREIGRTQPFGQGKPCPYESQLV